MPTAESVKKFIRSASLTTGFIFIANKYNNYIATKKKILTTSSDHFYDWNGIKVYFSKAGEGSPVLLLHAIHPASCSEEWSRIRDTLAANYSVYELDLPGCGRSDKPDDIYTNFYFVELIRSFIEDQGIKGCAVIASNNSAAIALMANRYNSALFDSIICINPPELHANAKTPDLSHRIRKEIFYTPFFGELVYNTFYLRSQVDYLFSDEYLYNPFKDTDDLVDTYYESAHLKDGMGRFLEGSLEGNFLNINIKPAIRECTKPLTIIFGSSLPQKKIIQKEWKDLNPEIHFFEINHAKELPQIEEPEKTLEIINNFL